MTEVTETDSARKIESGAKCILGCGTFGGVGGSPELLGKGLDESAAMNTMDEAIALGLDVFDTAERYAGGRSELMVGTWMAGNGMTDRVQIVTKVAPPPEPRNSFDAAYIRERLARSLERLRIDAVALYLIQHPTGSVAKPAPLKF